MEWKAIFMILATLGLGLNWGDCYMLVFSSNGKRRHIIHMYNRTYVIYRKTISAGIIHCIIYEKYVNIVCHSDRDRHYRTTYYYRRSRELNRRSTHHISEITAVASKFGNSAKIIVPRSWLGRRVIAFLHSEFTAKHGGTNENE